MSSHRLRLADLLAAAPSRDSSSYGRCHAPGCLEATRERKDFCLEHLGMSPYVADLERRIAVRQEQDAEVRELGEKAVDVGSVTVIELLRHLDQYGPRTEERCVRELSLDETTIRGYIDALRAEGFVDTGRTKRGSLVVAIAKAGGEHLRREVVQAPQVSMPAAKNVSADDAKLPGTTGGESSAKARRSQAMIGNGTVKSGLTKLREAHAAYEKAYSELAKAHAAGECDEVVLIWNDVTAAEIGVAEAKAQALGCILARGEKATKSPAGKKTEKPAAKPDAKKPDTKKPVAKKPVMSASAFSNWLRSVRANLGMTQSALGEKIGASYTQMFRWEKGLSIPGDEFIVKIERIAGKIYPYRQKAAV